MNLTLKQVPNGLHRNLKKRATKNRRSLNMEVINILEDAVEREILAELREINKRQRGIVTDAEIRAAIREGRE
jgi:plasmid stability protein